MLVESLRWQNFPLVAGVLVIRHCTTGFRGLLNNPPGTAGTTFSTWNSAKGGKITSCSSGNALYSEMQAGK